MENQSTPSSATIRLRLDLVFAFFLAVPILLLIAATVLRSDYLGKLGAFSAAPLGLLILGAFVANFTSRSTPEQRKAKVAKTLQGLLPELKANSDLQLQGVVKGKTLTVTSRDGNLFMDGTQLSDEDIIYAFMESKQLRTSKVTSTGN